MLDIYVSTVLISILSYCGFGIYWNINSNNIEYLEKNLNMLNLRVYNVLLNKEVGRNKANLEIVLNYIILTILLSIIPIVNIVLTARKFGEEYAIFKDIHTPEINKKIENKKYNIKSNLKDSLSIDGANLSNKISVITNSNKIINNELKNEKKDLINKEAQDMLDYICLNTELTSSQKKSLLKKLKRIYLSEKKDLRPIEYAINCDNKNKKRYIKK